MMGRKDKPQSPLFYSFDLEELVPQDHLLRKIDQFLDLSKNQGKNQDSHEKSKKSRQPNKKIKTAMKNQDNEKSRQP